MSSPPLMSTPKSQLNAEQPSIKKTETYQKRYCTSKDIGRSLMRWQEGHTHNIIISHTLQGGDPQTREQLHCRSSPTGLRVLSPMSGSLAWGSGIGRGALRAFGLEGQWHLNAGAPQDWGKQTLHSWSTHGIVCPGTQGKSAVT